jgi:copper homeostasis protein
MKILFEICAGSIASAMAAEEGGADRIELCSALSVDGLTPSWGMIREAKRLLSIPVFVLIRPREGNFVYTPTESEVICADIIAAKDLGADGIVCGALDKFGNIDVAVMERILKLSASLPFTFHRAFDVCKNPMEAAKILSELGVHTLLTSGQAATAVEGAKLIKELVGVVQPKGLTVMPGGGIKSANIASLITETGVNVVHLSARKRMEGGYDQTDVGEVQACRKVLNQ